MRILIADDHEAVRRGMRALLETQRGWNVCGEAGDGQEAIDRTKQLRPDVVILDISMPVLSGFAAARAIKEFYPDTAILVYSVYAPEAFLKEAKRLGLDGYISKSENRQALLNEVATLQRRLSDA
jgi:DNA-binding NarL/FixJ family response regulator